MYDGVSKGSTLLSQMKADGNYRPNVWLLFIDRGFYTNYNLSFYPGIVYEDSLFTFDCFLKAKKITHLNEQFYNRRIRPDLIVTSNLSFTHVYLFFSHERHIEKKCARC